LTIIQDDPDLIIFKYLLKNNDYQLFFLKQTQKDLVSIKTKLQKELANANILNISQKPVANGAMENSRLGINYIMLPRR
jgi:hypothetical protein